MTEGVVYLLNPAFIKVIGHLFDFVELEWIFVDNELYMKFFLQKTHVQGWMKATRYRLPLYFWDKNKRKAY